MARFAPNYPMKKREVRDDAFTGMAKWGKGQWWTADGRLLKISEMNDGHLENAIRVLEGKGVGEAAQVFNRHKWDENKKELEKFKFEGMSEDDLLVAEVEAKLRGGVPDFAVKKYNELLEERKTRINEDRWHPPSPPENRRRPFPR